MITIESERKFLVKELPFNRESSVHSYSKSMIITNKYLLATEESEVRVRESFSTSTKRSTYYLTVKKNTDSGVPGVLNREETEIEIPQHLYATLGSLNIGEVVKTRFIYEEDGITYSIDSYRGKNLITAEVELSEENDFKLPDWIGEEVTHDSRYLNKNLRNYGNLGSF